MMTFATYVKRYLNKRNPATGMYWTWDETIADSGLTREEITAYAQQAQAINLKKVESGAGIATDDEIISAWTRENSILNLSVEQFVKLVKEAK